MNLHENKEALQDAIRAASDYLGIREIFVEKDYWVTLMLKRLSLVLSHLFNNLLKYSIKSSSMQLKKKMI